MHPDHHFWFLGLLLVGAFGAHLLTIGIDSLLANLIGRHNGGRQQFKEPCCEAFTAGRIANNQRRIVQPSQLLRSVVEAIGTARHERHHQAASHKHRRRILVLLQPLADILQQREFF